MPQRNAFPGLIFVVLFGLGLLVAYPAGNAGDYGASVSIAALSFVVAGTLANSVKIANQWERVVVLRLGRFNWLAGPGLFFIIPIVDMVAYRIDIRVITATFKAEKTMTRDTVPVDVDAVLFWKVIDPLKAALDVADYVSAINWAAQTALRDVIGKTMLADMLEGREKLSAELQRIIDARTEPWGINVISVEVKDVQIPAALQDAMSMQAQAERERQARVILGDSERQVAEKFGEAAKTYADNPTAFHLRAMNMLYEGLKRSNSTIVIVPSTAVETMQLGGVSTLATIGSAIAHAKAAPGAGEPGGGGIEAPPLGVSRLIVWRGPRRPAAEKHFGRGSHSARHSLQRRRSADTQALPQLIDAKPCRDELLCGELRIGNAELLPCLNGGEESPDRLDHDGGARSEEGRRKIGKIVGAAATTRAARTISGRVRNRTSRTPNSESRSSGEPSGSSTSLGSSSIEISVEDRRQKDRLVREVAVQGHLRNGGPLGDGFHRRRRDPAFEKEPRCRVDDRRALLEIARPSPPSLRSGRGDGIFRISGHRRLENLLLDDNVH